MQNVREARPFSVSLHPRPLRFLVDKLVRVSVAHMVGHGQTVAVNLHAVIDFVAGRFVLPVGYGIKRTGRAVAVGTVGRTHAVGFYQMQAQGIRVDFRIASGCALEQHETIPRHQPRNKSQLLDSREIVHSRGVTARFLA